MGNSTEIRHDIGADGSLLLRNVSGAIRLTASDGTDAVVVVRTDRGSVPELNVERGPGRLLVEPPRSGFSFVHRGDGALDFDVVLPRGAKVDVKTVSGDIAGTGLAGEQNYKTVSGDLHLRGAGGRVSIQTVSGDIRLIDSRRVELSGMTTSGDVTLAADEIVELRMRTVSGDIRAEGRLGSQRRHSVETVSGDLVLRTSSGVTVERTRALDIGRSARQPIVIGDGAAQLSFRSMSGEERITGPAQVASPGEPSAPRGESMSEPTATRLDVLRALERGEIDVDEAARRLEEVGVDA